jgi:hypothetical protein
MLKRLAILFVLWPLTTVGILVGQDALKGTPKQGVTKPSSGQNGKAQSTPQDGKQAAPDAVLPTPQPSTPNCDEACQQARENLQIQRELSLFTGLLVFVGLLQVGTMLWQAWLLKQTRGEVHAQAKWMKTQSGYMESQTKILADSVGIAKESADASKRAVEIAILKERAKIRIEVARLDIQSYGQQTWIASVVVKIFNFGATKAFPLESYAVLGISPSTDRFTQKYSQPLITKAAIPPTEEPIGVSVVTTDANFETIWKMNTEQMFAHVYGTISYTDIFDEIHRTSFRYVWRTNTWVFSASAIASDDPNGSKALYGEWEKTEEDNEAN